MNSGVMRQDWFAAVWAFGWAVILLAIWYLRSPRKERMIERIHKERMTAMEKGIPLPELPDYEEKPGAISRGWSGLRLNPRWPLGVGALLVMAGLGTTIALFLSKEEYHNRVWSFGLENLALCCAVCNKHKGTDLASIDPETGEMQRLFDARRNQWHEHFELRGAEIVSRTGIGRVTIRSLRLNRMARRARDSA